MNKGRQTSSSFSSISILITIKSTRQFLRRPHQCPKVIVRSQGGKRSTMYPSVNKNDIYNPGHAGIIRSDFKDIWQYFGIVHRKVSCLDRYLFAVLPISITENRYLPLAAFVQRLTNRLRVHTLTKKEVWRAFC